MTKKDAVKLMGLYKLYWKSGGFSYASVGRTASGKVWMAPVNFITVPVMNYWSKVLKVEKIK